MALTLLPYCISQDNLHRTRFGALLKDRGVRTGIPPVRMPVCCDFQINLHYLAYLLFQLEWCRLHVSKGTNEGIRTDGTV